MTAAEETCNCLLNVWIVRHVCRITFQSDNGKEFVGDFTNDLMKRSQVPQATQTFTTSRRMAWLKGRIAHEFPCRELNALDKHLPHVMGIYNSMTQTNSWISQPTLDVNRLWKNSSVYALSSRLWGEQGGAANIPT